MKHVRKDDDEQDEQDDGYLDEHELMDSSGHVRARVAHGRAIGSELVTDALMASFRDLVAKRCDFFRNLAIFLTIVSDFNDKVRPQHCPLLVLTHVHTPRRPHRCTCRVNWPTSCASASWTPA